MCSGKPKQSAPPPAPPPIPPAALIPQEDVGTPAGARNKSRGRSALRMQDAQVGTSGGAVGLGIPSA